MTSTRSRSPVPPPPLPLSRPRVLVVEDEAGSAAALQEALVHASCDVVVVGSGEDALKALELDSFQLALVDLILPGMDGKQLLRRMAENLYWAAIPAIVVSAQDAVLPYNAVSFLKKPIFPDELLALVQRYARHP